VTTSDIKCRPDLAMVATRARNVEYNPQRFSAAIIRLREPKATALLFNSGKLVVTGTKNEDDGLLAARKVAKIVQKLGFPASFADFRVQNMVSTGDLGWPVRLEGLADEHAKFSSVRGQQRAVDGGWGRVRLQAAGCRRV
jgi:transcription initiation factor TFIID TATA-box-binding protein